MSYFPADTLFSEKSLDGCDNLYFDTTMEQRAHSMEFQRQMNQSSNDGFLGMNDTKSDGSNSAFHQLLFENLSTGTERQFITSQLSNQTLSNERFNLGFGFNSGVGMGINSNVSVNSKEKSNEQNLDTISTSFLNAPTKNLSNVTNVTLGHSPRSIFSREEDDTTVKSFMNFAEDRIAIPALRSTYKVRNRAKTALTGSKNALPMLTHIDEIKPMLIRLINEIMESGRLPRCIVVKKHKLKLRSQEQQPEESIRSNLMDPLLTSLMVPSDISSTPSTSTTPLSITEQGKQRRRYKKKEKIVLCTLDDFIHFLLHSVIKRKKDSVILDPLEAASIQSVITDHFQEHELTIMNILRAEEIIIGSKQSVLSAPQKSNLNTLTTKQMVKAINKNYVNEHYGLETLKAPTDAMFEWAETIGWSNKPPKIDFTLIGAHVIAVMYVACDYDDYPPWVKKPYILQRNLEAPVIGNVYLLLNRIVSLLSLSSMVEMNRPDQTIIHNIAFRILDLLPENMVRRHEKLVRIVFPPAKPQKTIIDFFGKRKVNEKTDVVDTIDVHNEKDTHKKKKLSEQEEMDEFFANDDDNQEPNQEPSQEQEQ